MDTRTATATGRRLPERITLMLGLALLGACATHDPSPAPPVAGLGCQRVVTADVVALEQAYTLNRFGAFVPAGLLYALKHDVVAARGSGAASPGNAMLRPDKRPRPLVLRVNEGDCLDVSFENYLSPTWSEEGGVDRLPAHMESRAGSRAGRELVPAGKVSVDAPRTRTASFHVTGLERVPMRPEDCPVGAACGGDGSNVGMAFASLVFNRATPPSAVQRFDAGSLAAPGQRVVTRWRAAKEGTYFAYSAAASVGGEGDGGQIGLGLFAAVNVEPKGSRWYRSQVTHEVLAGISRPAGDGRHPYAAIDYEAERPGPGGRRPVLAMLDRANRIVHGDVNALVVLPEGGESSRCQENDRHMYGDSCGRSFREFTVILHDEIHAQQAFAELEDEDNPLHYLKDGMGINYGASGMGSAVMSTPLQRQVGVAANCPECRAEEFFLSSWANGDPALVLRWDEQGRRPIGARWPDDPSNVHHSYLGDPVRFRNLHAGPKETHVFHLHAHQWVLDSQDPDSTYLDSQTISPGASFSYGIEFGGSGNRNFTPGDSIFHCHLYPHFAQGMWELWRVHDVFEDGNHAGLYDPARPAGAGNDPRWRRLPDAEVAGGTESPAVVPIPGQPLAPLPGAEFAGYPFYIPGQAGHRPPQPPLDMDVADPAYQASGFEAPPDAAAVVDGGLPRHVVGPGSSLRRGREDAEVRRHALENGGEAARLIARRVAAQDPVAVDAFAAAWDQLTVVTLPHEGSEAERRAMRFHEGELASAGPTRAAPAQSGWWPETRGYRTDHAATVAGQSRRNGEAVFRVNGRPRAPGAPYANPCPDAAPTRHYRAAFIQTELTYNKHGWFDPQGRIVILENDIKDIIDPLQRTRLPEPLFFRANSGECIDFKSTNLVPSVLNADDFQVLTPTDTIGQHIHLVKFDVTSSDGSGNGWNYEDGTFSPDEVRERIFAHNRTPNADGSPRTEAQKLRPKTHPLFAPGGDIFEAARRDPRRHAALLKKGQCPPKPAGHSEEQYEELLRTEHPLCGAQRSTQRWWADPILNARGRDNTLRTVFTHDHFGPSSHQQHGLYAGLVIEPANSVWTRVDASLTPADLLAAGAAAQGARPLRCELPRLDARGQPTPGRSPLCDRLIGGSDLSRPTEPALQRDAGHVLSPVEPRRPLALRGDGGPTATMANIIAPACTGDGDSNPLQPEAGRNRPAAGACDRSAADQTRREFTLAIADFGIAYNTALEPINPEPRGEDSGLRDDSAIRFGRRHVAMTPARPLGISSEDPGSQFINYRHEPLALRIAEATPRRPGDGKPGAALGGFDYRQHPRRANGEPCKPGDQDCLGDMANAFSSAVHERRDLALAKEPQRAEPSSTTRELMRSMGLERSLDARLAEVETWRRRFNCALYPLSLLPVSKDCPREIERLEPWRVFGDPATPVLPAFEGDPVQVRLVQGAQEAQHVFAVNGVRWHRMPGSLDSGFLNAQPLGISEHFEFDIRMATLDNSHTDYLYYGSSIDQLWDGMWGVLRSFGLPKADASGEYSLVEPAGLARLPGTGGGLAGQRVASNMVCMPGGDASPYVSRRRFDVSAVQVCQLYGNCRGDAPAGIDYNRRLGIRDDKAIVYVLNAEGPGGAKPATYDEPNGTVMRRLQAQFAAGRPLEPLVLRAAAGECIAVKLRNHLPAQLVDGPRAPAEHADGLPERHAYHNHLPMITDGFNMNQYSMSSSVGLSIPRLAQHPLYAGGSNVGLNGRVLALSEGANAVKRQGSLVPACTDEAPDASARCQRESLWWAGDFGGTDRPVEFGAVPITSFGDAIKHPAHGLVGALVIGPAGSTVCRDDRHSRDPAGQPLAWPSRLSAEICHADGSRHADHVLVMQDAVNARFGEQPLHNLSGAEEPDDYGMKAINYRTEPLWGRAFGDPTVGFSERNGFDYTQVLSSQPLRDDEGRVVGCRAGIRPLLALRHPCDPETPVLRAKAGERLRLHFVHPGGHTRQQGLAVAGHAWNPYPWADGSSRLDASQGSSIRQGVLNGFGPMMGVTLELTAGGRDQVPMDYLIRSQASFLFDGGLWGLLRVEP